METLTPHIVSICYTPSDQGRRPYLRFSRVAVERVILQAGHGIVGDAKARSDSRQLNVMLAETIEQLNSEGFRTAPGELGEQIVIAGLPRQAGVPGARLQLGESAVIELGYLRVPCGRFERIQDKSKELVRGRIGFMARVLIGGEVGVGSPVMVIPTPVKQSIWM